ncbi:MAG TPA: CBS domain-containing protein [Bacteroidales bacterium]|nr:CBS domain-containing protein [Bacteroidales bacterium]
MTLQTTFYLSQLLGKKFISLQGNTLGKIKDFFIDLSSAPGIESEPVRPRVVAVRVIIGKEEKIYDFSSFEIKKFRRYLQVICHEIQELSIDSFSYGMWLGENILDKQIVDINGRKLVRVNDVRMVMIPSGTYAIAVDVGIQGLLRRIGIEQYIETLLDPVGLHIPGKVILWDDIQAVDFDNSSIKLSKSFSKLHTLHPSDLADIIEDLDKATRSTIFASLDEEKAADVLEELEPKAQIDIIESMPIEKAADVLEKMPADEVADLLDVLEEEKAIKLLDEMEKESSEEVRELLEYPDKVVGSIMSTDFYTFPEETTVEEAIAGIRKEKPEPSNIYSIFVTDKNNRLVSAVSLMELVVADPVQKLKKIMKKNPVMVYDQDKVDSLAELVSKYNLLAVPVVNKNFEMEGVVVVEDIVEDLLSKRKTT